MAKSKLCFVLAHAFPTAYLPLNDAHPGIVSLFADKGWPLIYCPIMDWLSNPASPDTVSLATFLAAVREFDQVSYHSWNGYAADPADDDRDGPTIDVYTRTVLCLNKLALNGVLKTPFCRCTSLSYTTNPGTRTNNLPDPKPDEMWFLLDACVSAPAPGGYMTHAAAAIINSWDESGVTPPDGKASGELGPDSWLGLKLGAFVPGGDANLAALDTFMATLQGTQGGLALFGAHDKGDSDDLSDTFKAYLISSIATAIGANPQMNAGIVSGDGWLELGTLQAFMARDYGYKVAPAVRITNAVTYTIDETKYLLVTFSGTVSTERGVLTADGWDAGGDAELTPAMGAVNGPYVLFTYTGDVGLTLDWNYKVRRDELVDSNGHVLVPGRNVPISPTTVALPQSARYYPTGSGRGKLVVRIDKQFSDNTVSVHGFTGVLDTTPARVVEFIKPVEPNRSSSRRSEYQRAGCSRVDCMRAGG